VEERIGLSEGTFNAIRIYLFDAVNADGSLDSTPVTGMTVGDTSVVLMMGQERSLSVTKKAAADGEASEAVVSRDLYEGDLCLLEGPLSSSFILNVTRGTKGGVQPRKVRPTFGVHFRTILVHSSLCPLSHSPDDKAVPIGDRTTIASEIPPLSKDDDLNNTECAPEAQRKASSSSAEDREARQACKEQRVKDEARDVEIVSPPIVAGAGTAETAIELQD